SAVSVPVDALAAALRQTVGESGLFYESHLAQWLSGLRPLASLSDEPQNRLVAESAQLPLDWILEGDAEADGDGVAAWWHGGASGQPGGAGEPNPGAARDAQGNPMPMSARFVAAVQEFAEDAFGSGASAQSARDGASAANANSGQANAPQAQLSTQMM